MKTFRRAGQATRRTEQKLKVATAVAHYGNPGIAMAFVIVVVSVSKRDQRTITLNHRMLKHTQYTQHANHHMACANELQ